MNVHENTPEKEVVIEGGAYVIDAPEHMTDIGHLVPDLLPYLREGEKVVYVEEVPRQRRITIPSAVLELQRLTKSDNIDEIGKNGPVIAATTLNDDETRSELHLYEAVFGRDSLFVAHELLDVYPELAKSTLRTLASVQGTTWNTASEEEPGKIPHEIRNPESDTVARILSEERGWAWPYYGAVDATPMYVRLFAAYVSRIDNGVELLEEKYQAKDGTYHTMQESLDSALSWMRMRMDANPDGFIEYKKGLPGGIENQMWRDSWDSFFHADGRIANREHGIASLDVQRITYDAVLEIAELYEKIPFKQATAQALYIQATLLRKKILETFWVEPENGRSDAIGFFALGTERDERGAVHQLKIKTSDMGHLLYSRLLDGDDEETTKYRESIVRHLFSPTMLATGGIRTLASDEIRYRPSAYHNGTVWPAFNYLISQGLRRHGLYTLAREIDERNLKIVHMTGELPEYVSGNDGEHPVLSTRIVDVWDATHGKMNRIEQPPQEVQAWTVAAVAAIQRVHAVNADMPLYVSALEREILDSFKL